MPNKSVLYGLGLLLAVLALLLSGGMGRERWLGGMVQPKRATLRVLGGAAYQGGERGAAMRFELSECAGHRPTQSATVPLWADSVQRFRAFAHLRLRPQSAHRFGDITWQVTPGCYRVRAAVVDRAGVAVGACEPADSPNSFLEVGESQNYVFLLDCRAFSEQPRNAGIRLQGILNRAPRLDPLELTELGGGEQTCAQTRVCASAQDPDGDPLQFEWTLRSESGRALRAPAPTAESTRHAGQTQLRECLTLGADTLARSVEVTVRDLSSALPAPSAPEALLSFEDLYLGDFGLIAPSRDQRSAQLHRTCNPASCPPEPADRIQSVRYWIARDGQLRPPTPDLSQVRPGDTVDVEFDVLPGCAPTRVEFATYQRGATQKMPQNHAPMPQAPGAVSLAANTYAAGTHILWNMLPECQFRVEFRVAPGVVGQPFQVIDAFEGGDTPCPAPIKIHQK